MMWDEGARASLFFAAYKTLRASGRRIKVEGYFRRIRSVGLRFEPEADVGAPFLCGTQQIDLSSLTTDAPTRDANLLKHLFRLKEATRYLTVALEPTGQSLEIHGEQAWTWRGSVSLGFATPVLVPCSLRIERDQIAGRMRLRARCQDPIRVSVEGLGLPFAEFLAAVGMPLIEDCIELDWATVCCDQAQAGLPRVAIAGGGIAGLAAAQVLIDKGYDVTLIEKNPTVGGKASSYIDETLGHTVEHGIHGVFPRYENLKRLWREAGISDAIYSETRTTGMPAGTRMSSVELAHIGGLAPFFLWRMLPRGVLRLRDLLSTVFFIMRVYAARVQPANTLDFGTFKGLLDRFGVSVRAQKRLLIPYVRNLSYARGEEVSSHAAADALGYYVLENADDVKAQWLDGGPQELVFNPWFRELAKRGVRFITKTPVKAVELADGRLRGFATSHLLKEAEFGTEPKHWVEQIGHHHIAFNWQPESRTLRAWSAACTHEGCPVKAYKEATGGGFRCDCHGGVFGLNGEVLRAPPTRPLAPIAVERVASGDDGLWKVMVEADEADEEAFVAADYGVLALDIVATQNVLDAKLLRLGSLRDVPLLRTTSVLVMRMWFCVDPWQGPDSGVFTGDDFLDNFFVLNTFQTEFKALQDRVVIECHVSDSERLKVLTDDQVLDEACRCLEVYFPELTSTALDRDRCRVLRHDSVFSLYAPGDHEKAPTVGAADRPSLFMAGDWVRTDKRSWFMERAAITGIEAANGIIERHGGTPRIIVEKPQPPWSVKFSALPFVLWHKFTGLVRHWAGLDA